MDAFDRVNRKFMRESRLQAYVVYGTATLALYEEWGWRKKRLDKLIAGVQTAWDECASDVYKSAIKMLDDETGIEIKADENGPSYRDLEYMSGNFTRRKLSMAQVVYIRNRQIKWIGAQVTAILFLALHRQYGFSTVRLERLLTQMREMDVDRREVKIRDLVLEKTGVDLKHYIE